MYSEQALMRLLLPHRYQTDNIHMHIFFILSKEWVILLQLTEERWLSSRIPVCLFYTDPGGQDVQTRWSSTISIERKQQKKRKVAKTNLFHTV